MKTISKPNRKDWPQLLLRPSLQDERIRGEVRAILARVRSEGDKALKAYNKTFDGVETAELRVSEMEFQRADEKVSQKLKEAIKLAAETISRFHRSQMRPVEQIETAKGINCWRKQVAIDKVGLYIPGGSAPLFSSLLMLGIPAKIAGCGEIIVCSPPQKDGNIHPAILYTANQIGIKQIFKTGGAQAIAAMAYGTEHIPSVYKIFGPGNQYVTFAKTLIQEDGIAIDMPAGPSELLIIADESARPAYVAADLLSQAEHGPDSQVVFLSNSEKLIQEVQTEIQVQVENLPRKNIALQSLKNSLIIRFESIDECIDFSNAYAPEHLIIASDDSAGDAEKITNAGSVFIGNFSCESAGDYASGTNHTLPTNGYAKNYSGVSLDSFCKSITFQELSPGGIRSIGEAVEIMAEEEGLYAHKNAMTLRLNDIRNV